MNVCRLFGVMLFVLILSCKVPKNISGDYLARLDDSLYKIYHFSPDNRFEWKGVYKGEFIAQDSGNYLLRNDSIYFCLLGDSASTDCDGVRIKRRKNGNLVFRYTSGYLPTCGSTHTEVEFRGKMVLKKVKPRD